MQKHTLKSYITYIQTYHMPPFRLLTLNEFVAPKSVNPDPFIEHQPFQEVIVGKAFTVTLAVAMFEIQPAVFVPTTV